MLAFIAYGNRTRVGLNLLSINHFLFASRKLAVITAKQLLTFTLRSPARLLFSLSGLCAIGAFTVVPFFYWSPASEYPLNLRQNSSSNFEVRVRRDAEYQMWLVASRSFAWKPIACLMGTVVPAGDCPSDASVVDITWSLQKDGAELANGPPSDGSGAYYAKDRIGKSLGHLHLNGGERYRLEIHSFKDATKLNRNSLRIVIALAQGETDAFQMTFVSTIVASLTLLALAVIFTLGSALLGSFRPTSRSR
jgi:hypothetical protein